MTQISQDIISSAIKDINEVKFEPLPDEQHYTIAFFDGNAKRSRDEFCNRLEKHNIKNEISKLRVYSVP